MKIKHLIYYFLCILLTTGCTEIIQTVSKAAEENQEKQEEVAGNYHLLTSSKIFLPKGFNPISIDDFRQEQLTIGVDSMNANLNKLQLQQIEHFSDEFYLFRDELTRGVITVSKIPYTPINKNTALQIIAFVENGIKQNPTITHERTEAKFNSYESFKFLKSTFLLHHTKQGTDTYKCMYVISDENYKTYMIIIDTALEPDFDKYIQQIKL